MRQQLTGFMGHALPLESLYIIAFSIQSHLLQPTWYTNRVPKRAEYSSGARLNASVSAVLLSHPMHRYIVLIYFA